MLRWTFSLAVLFAMLAASSELMAQRRAPLRNIARQIGVRWSPGYHWQNPGHDTSYYSPWSEHNTSDHVWQGNNGQIINGQEGQLIQPAIPPAVPTPAPSENSLEIENSATHLLNQPTQQQNWNGNPKSTSYGTGTIQQGTRFNSTSQENLQINRYLKPYHSKPAINPIQIPNGGGQFKPTTIQKQIAPSQIPSDNIGWSSRYNQQFRQRTTRGN